MEILTFYKKTMKTSTRASNIILLVIFIISSLTSCGNIMLVGYGVVLWGGEEFSLSPGTLVEIHSQNSLDQTYTISTIEDYLEYTVKKGFIAKFENKKKAAAFHKRYSRYLDSYAVAEANGLRIRETPGIDGSTVYKLRRGDEVKVVDKVSVTGQNEPYKGTWYRVVTHDGYEGYSYGKYLTLRTGEEKIEHDSTPDLYKQLSNRFFSSKWRPDYMKRMVRQKRIDLERFDPQIGLFPDEEKKKIHVGTIKNSYVFTFDTARVSPPKTLIFSNGDLRVQFIDDTTIMVEYEARGSLVRENYVLLDVSVEEAIEAEKERRIKKYKKFIEKGTHYVSSHYGALHFKEKFTVTWKWREDVPEHILPAEAGEEGRLEFDVVLAPELRKAYTGAFSLVFPFAEREHEVTFVYERTQNGLRFIYIPEDLISKNEVRSLPPSSQLIMFFYNQNT